MCIKSVNNIIIRHMYYKLLGHIVNNIRLTQNSTCILRA